MHVRSCRVPWGAPRTLLTPAKVGIVRAPFSHAVQQNPNPNGGAGTPARSRAPLLDLLLTLEATPIDPQKQAFASSQRDRLTAGRAALYAHQLRPATPSREKPGLQLAGEWPTLNDDQQRFAPRQRKKQRGWVVDRAATSATTSSRLFIEHKSPASSLLLMFLPTPGARRRRQQDGDSPLAIGSSDTSRSAVRQLRVGGRPRRLIASPKSTSFFFSFFYAAAQADGRSRMLSFRPSSGAWGSAAATEDGPDGFQGVGGRAAHLVEEGGLPERLVEASLRLTPRQLMEGFSRGGRCPMTADALYARSGMCSSSGGGPRTMGASSSLLTSIARRQVPDLRAVMVKISLASGGDGQYAVMSR
ncbi:hypothetical protein BDW22DRAFT_1348629 [Trametopsis cervina]|nr:hypothetical protein BDW22DRAFT_1348629 [Trametopsis cervina]